MKKYYGTETEKALKNFPFSTNRVNSEFIFSIVKIKKAAALSNYKAGNINHDIKNSIVKSCDEIISGIHNDQFLLPTFQGGAGTAINMNVNEVIANRATEILDHRIIVHPNDHVNCSQSTNDVNPSALRISVYYFLNDLDASLVSLINSFELKAREFARINKLGRTHMQDAIPTTLGLEFYAYTEILKNHKKHLSEIRKIMLSLNLGGTAIGDSTNASPKYIKDLYLELNKITKINFKQSKNLMASTSSQTDFLIVSQAIVALCVDLSKIASDLRFMSSGPNGGIGEIILPEIQKGSSIMPGKVNPVMPETVNQLYYLVSGNNLTIEKASEAANLELGVMLPVTIDRLIESIILTKEVIAQFDKLCVSGIIANKERCLYNLENSTAYATLLVPKLGYDIVSEIVKESVVTGKSLREVSMSKKYISEKEFDLIVTKKSKDKLSIKK